MSTLAVDESPLEQFYRNVEDAIFGTLFELQKTRKEEYVRINYLTGLASILLDFVQLVPFFIHGYGFGTITITWGRFLRYIQLQLELPSFEVFAPAFWGAVGVTLIVTVLTSFVFYTLYQKNVPHPAVSVALNLAYHVVLHVFFIAGFKLLLTPWWCDGTRLFPFPSMQCFSGLNLIYLIVGSIFAVILTSLVLTAALAPVNLAPVPFDLFAVATPVYRIAFIGALMFMTISENLIAPSIAAANGGNYYLGRWWEALFNWIIMTGLIVIVAYRLPFQLPEGNLWRAGLLSAAWWVSACTFVVANMAENLTLGNRIIDYLTLAGMVPCFFIGYYIVAQRYLVFQSVATALVQEVEDNFDSNELYRAKYGTKVEDTIVGAFRNPFIYLPVTLQQFGSDSCTIEIIGRFLWHITSEKTHIEAAYRMYRKAEQAFPDLAFVKFMRANCLTFLSADPTAFIDQVEGVRLLDPSFYVRFLLYKLDAESKIRGSRAKRDGFDDNNNIDLVAYVEFQKYYSEAQKYNGKAITSLRDFWSLFLQPSISIVQFGKASHEIEITSQKALAIYKTLLVRYPKHVYILSSYAYFLELVMHNAEEAERYHRRANQLRAREADDTGLDGSTLDSQAVISISEEGTLEQVNKAVTTLFGWGRNELIGRNIKLLVPSPYKEKHDVFLDRYRTTGNVKVIGQPPRALFGMHREGYSFPVLLSVQERRKENGDRAYMGTLIPTEMEDNAGTIIISEDGTVQTITKSIVNLFGYSAVEVLRQNVTVFMVDAYAANHDSYLRRYKETGEARVIGTAGRNVPARRKDGTVFPASLTVEELYLGSDRFYQAVLIDTSSVVGTIYMDGYGILMNIDAGVGHLLGYRKEDVQGKNIKNIMPPPYNLFHDMYLERYRRTKISNVLRSTEGRLLPAVHADGSVVQIKAIIQRADTGNSGSSLFKGIIRRVDASERERALRLGFDDRHLLEFKKDGTIINVDKTVLSILGYSADKDPHEYVGQSIDVLVPPAPDRPRQKRSFWIPQGLAQPDSNFYILMLTKSGTLFPFTYCLSLKSSDHIIMRVRDLVANDALITIDENGTVLNVNDDAFLLLGHEADDLTGRNIKYILAEDVAKEHDSYLARYKETRVARIVGGTRTLTSIHRDKSVMPLELQLAETRTPDGNHYTARIRHIAIEERLDHDFINGLWKNTASNAMDENVLFEERMASLHSLKGSKIKLAASQSASKTGSQIVAASASVSVLEDDDYSFSESDDESETSEAEIAALGIEAKIKDIRDSEIEDRSVARLGQAINYTLGFFVALLTIALVSCNLIANPVKHFAFLNQLNLQSNILNNAIFITRLMYYQQNNNDLLDQITGNSLSKNYWPCSFNGTYTKNGVTLKQCAFAYKFYPIQKLQTEIQDLQDSQEWFSINYISLRKEGDELDSVYNAPFAYYEYDKGVNVAPSESEIPNWADFLAKVVDALDKLMANSPKSKINENLESRLDFKFIQKNRNVMLDRLTMVQDSVFARINSIMSGEVLLHLILTIIFTVGGAVVFFAAFVPRIRDIQNDRIMILKLMLLVPKSVVWDFVYTIYRDTDEDDENMDDDMIDENGNSGKAAKDAMKAKALKMRSEDPVDIVNDNAYGLYYFFGLGIASMCLPLIVHVAWRYTFNNSWSTELTYFYNIVTLFTYANSLLWLSTGVWSPCEISRANDQDICLALMNSTFNLRVAADKAYAKYYAIQKDFAGDDAMDKLLYSVDQLTGIFPTCQDETIKVKIYGPNTPTYEVAAEAVTGTVTTTKYRTVLARESRCNITYTQQDGVTPPDLRLPDDYAIRATHGVGNYVRNALQAAWAIGETPGYTASGVPPVGPISDALYWFLFEGASEEGADGLQAVKKVIEEKLLSHYRMSNTAFNATYAVTLVYTLIIFFWVFANCKKDLLNESRHNRGILFMVPLPIIAKSRPIIEYIERTFQELVS